MFGPPEHASRRDPTPATDWDSFEVDWDVVKDDYDSVLYVYGHSDGQRIQLSDVANDPKYELLASSLKKFRKRARGSASIFMLNGCRTAAPSPASAEEPISANFLKETRQPGYYGFIGTEAQYLTFSPAATAQSFYGDSAKRASRWERHLTNCSNAMTFSPKYSLYMLRGSQVPVYYFSF